MSMANINFFESVSKVVNLSYDQTGSVHYRLYLPTMYSDDGVLQDLLHWKLYQIRTHDNLPIKFDYLNSSLAGLGPNEWTIHPCLGCEKCRVVAVNTSLFTTERDGKRILTAQNIMESVGLPRQTQINIKDFTK